MISIFHNPAAFAPFYDDVVAVEGAAGRPLRTGPLAACVLDQGLDDPVAEGGVASARRRFTVSIRVADWPASRPPQIGDVVILADGDVRLSVLSAARSHGDFVMEARTC